MFGRNKNNDVPQYETRLETVHDRMFPPKGVTKMANGKIREMERKGWELVSQSRGTGATITLQFRRQK